MLHRFKLMGEPALRGGVSSLQSAPLKVSVTRGFQSGDTVPTVLCRAGRSWRLRAPVLCDLV